MPGLEWTQKRPDFDNPDRYEKEGWEKTGKSDIPHRNGRFVPWASFGTTDPLDRIGIVTEYQNEILNMRAVIIDFLDQGIVYTEWLMRNNIKIGAPRGLALFINNRWVVKKTDETFSLDVEMPASGKKIVNKVRISFLKRVGPAELIKTSSIVIVRED